MRRSYLGVLFVITTIIILTIVSHYFGLFFSVEKFFRRGVNFVSDPAYKWGISLLGEDYKFESVTDLEKAYAVALQKIASSTVDNIRLDLAEEENFELRQQLNYLQQKKFVYVGTSIIGRNVEAVGSTLVIDRGSDDGIIIGDAAIVQNGILVGKVIRVEPETSIVRIISDAQSRVAATVINENRSLGVVEGGFGISVRMNFIPQNEKINIGDTVITSGLESGVPRGLVIGLVEAVEKEPFQPFQRAIITPATNLNKLRLITIITQA